MGLAGGQCIGGSQKEDENHADEQIARLPAEKKVVYEMQSSHPKSQQGTQTGRKKSWVFLLLRREIKVRCKHATLSVTLQS